LGRNSRRVEGGTREEEVERRRKREREGEPRILTNPPTCVGRDPAGTNDLSSLSSETSSASALAAASSLLVLAPAPSTSSSRAHSRQGKG
jgi:hypothetical protein